ncbi:MAG: ADP-ribosylglycohydrolase family protein [Candidatus Sumerlaeia bacterium]|nr:ADP-ribosylglycohydrolase family protein [Candidatus Sumerlaeia bacterium]
MLGAIAGDVIGSVYEILGIKTKDFPLFESSSRVTDDSVLTVAVAEAVLTDGDYLRAIREVGRRHPDAGYGGTFVEWLMGDNPKPYNSWGNGSAMRVSPVGWAFDSEEDVLREAARSAEISHNHPEGIKGAQAVALAVYMARMKATKEDIRKEISNRFGYDLHRSVDEIRPDYKFDVSCQGSVPEAIISFLEAGDFENAVRNAVSLGGDTDTQASMAGAIAEAYFGGVPPLIAANTKARIPVDLLPVVVKFQSTYMRK